MKPSIAILTVATLAHSAVAADRTGVLTDLSPTWDRPSQTGAIVNGDCNGVTASDSVNDAVAHEVFYFRALKDGVTLDVKVSSLEPHPLDLDPFAAVYCAGFDPTDPLVNLLEIDDDGAGYPNAHAFGIAALDTKKTYRIVVSSYSNWPRSQHGAFEVALGAGLAFVDPCPGDLADPIGTLNFFDVVEYLALFSDQDPGADLAAPFGVINFFDIVAYLDLFNQGCP